MTTTVENSMMVVPTQHQEDITTITDRTPALRIRYADPDTVPGTYGAQGYRADSVILDGYWTLRGSVYALSTHVGRALNDNNLNDYIWIGMEEL